MTPAVEQRLTNNTRTEPRVATDTHDLHRTKNIGPWPQRHSQARGVFPLVIQHHPYRSGTDFRREFVRRLAHKGSILFGS